MRALQCDHSGTFAMQRQGVLSHFEESQANLAIRSVRLLTLLERWATATTMARRNLDSDPQWKPVSRLVDR